MGEVEEKLEDFYVQDVDSLSKPQSSYEKDKAGMFNRVNAIVSSHKKMRRSASAPNVAKNDILDANMKKRNRTSPEQLLILEEAFLKNPTPNGQTRDILAERVDMSPRSVQIWFQNRRAKMKLQEKKTHGKTESMYPGYSSNNVNRLMRTEVTRHSPLSYADYSYSSTSTNPQYLFLPDSPSNITAGSSSSSEMINLDTPPSLSPASSFTSNPTTTSITTSTSNVTSNPSSTSNPNSTQTTSSNLNSNTGPRTNAPDNEFRTRPVAIAQNQLPVGAPRRMSQAPRGQSRIVFNLDRLKIGSWTRLTITPADLICKIDPTFQLMSWEIVEGPHRCKIEFSYNHITSFDLQIVNDDISLLTIVLTQVPLFFLEVRAPDGRTVWKGCSDITEGQQASHHSKHVVQGPPNILKHYLSPLISSDPIISKVASIKDETRIQQSIQQTLQVKFSDDSNITLNGQEESEEAKTMKKSQSVPALSRHVKNTEYNYLDFLSQDLIGDDSPFIDYSSTLSEFPDLDLTPNLGLDMELGSFSEDFSAFNSPDLENSDSIIPPPSN